VLKRNQKLSNITQRLRKLASAQDMKKYKIPNDCKEIIFHEIDNSLWALLSSLKQDCFGNWRIEWEEEKLEEIND
jgi:hypothetical protein